MTIAIHDPTLALYQFVEKSNFLIEKFDLCFNMIDEYTMQKHESFKLIAHKVIGLKVKLDVKIISELGETTVTASLRVTKRQLPRRRKKSIPNLLTRKIRIKLSITDLLSSFPYVSTSVASSIMLFRYLESVE